MRQMVALGTVSGSSLEKKVPVKTLSFLFPQKTSSSVFFNTFAIRINKSIQLTNKLSSIMITSDQLKEVLERVGALGRYL